MVGVTRGAGAKPIEKGLAKVRKSNSMIITSGVSSSVRFNFG